jgi:hypothetical protein
VLQAGFDQVEMPVSMGAERRPPYRCFNLYLDLYLVIESWKLIEKSFDGLSTIGCYTIVTLGVVVDN